MLTNNFPHYRDVVRQLLILNCFLVTSLQIVIICDHVNELSQCVHIHFMHLFLLFDSVYMLSSNLITF